MKDNKKIITKQIYSCPICENQYEKEEDAEECLKKGFEPKFKIGDIVFTKAGFGWWDGDKGWISNPDILIQAIKEHGNCFSECCTYRFYYVITHIDMEPGNSHGVRYHVFTKAMKGGYRSGYTFEEGHYVPILVENPPAFIVKDSKNLIGEKAKYLL